MVPEQRSGVLQKPARPTLPVMTYGTEEHLAWDAGQTLPDFPHSLPFTDKWIPRRDGQGDGAFLPPTLCLVTCQGALSCSVAECQQSKKAPARKRHPL